MTKVTGWPTKLLWVDLEMTGLDPVHDVILEVAAEVTDFDFKTIASYEARVRHDRDLVVKRMQESADWWKTVPGNRDEFLKKLEGSKTSKVVEEELIELVDKNFGEELAVIAGNSIHNDRSFIKHWWPAFDLKLHYRMLDVTSLKVLMQGKYNTEFEKSSTHRAFDDIQASIAELQHYLEQLKK